MTNTSKMTRFFDGSLNALAVVWAAFTVAATLATALALSLCGQAQTYSVLYQFKSGPGGVNPQGGVILDSKGDLYGTTSLDGAHASANVFKLSATGKQTILYNFTGLKGDGEFPYYGSLVRDSAGNLYGTTYGGGIHDQYCPFGCGAVFKIAPTGKETVLYAFTGTNGDGLQPYAGVIRDSAGNLYGMTQAGGANGLGAVYRIDSTGKETILYSFTGAADGCYPYMGVTRDSAGNLYGTTDSELCGDGAGTVFKLTPSGTLTTLYSFSGGADGSGPWSGLILDSSGNLYGTTRNGGAYGYGTVYKVTSTGTETVLYSFAGGTDAQSPAFASLVRDKAGNLYGTTQRGGADAFGAVFKIDATGKETVLHSFAQKDGSRPFGTLFRDAKGTLYGTTYEGGAHGGGVVFKIAP